LSDILWVFTRLNLLSLIDIVLVALIFYALFNTCRSVATEP